MNTVDRSILSSAIFSPAAAGFARCNGSALTHKTDMQMVGLRDIALDYAETLKHWQAFLAELDGKSMGFDEKFIECGGLASWLL